MTRFVVDCGVVLHLAGEEIDVAAEHELLAPTLLRSQTLSALHEAVHSDLSYVMIARSNDADWDRVPPLGPPGP